MLIILISCTLRDTVTAVFLCLYTSPPNNIIGCHNVADVAVHVAIHITTKFNSINWGWVFFFLCLWVFQFHSPNRSSITLVAVMNVCMYVLYEKLYSLHFVYVCIYPGVNVILNTFPLLYTLECSLSGI